MQDALGLLDALEMQLHAQSNKFARTLGLVPWTAELLAKFRSGQTSSPRLAPTASLDAAAGGRPANHAADLWLAVLPSEAFAANGRNGAIGSAATVAWLRRPVRACRHHGCERERAVAMSGCFHEMLCVHSGGRQHERARRWSGWFRKVRGSRWASGQGHPKISQARWPTPC